MHWIHLTEEGQLQKIIVRSQEKPQVIFKYSTHCQASELMLNKLQNNCCPQHMDFHFLDLTDHENISRKVSETFHVIYHSPQILLIRNGECIFERTDSETSFEEIMEHVPAVVH